MDHIPKLEKHFFRAYSVEKDVAYSFVGNSKGCDLFLGHWGPVGAFWQERGCVRTLTRLEGASLKAGGARTGILVGNDGAQWVGRAKHRPDGCS